MRTRGRKVFLGTPIRRVGLHIPASALAAIIDGALPAWVLTRMF
jgi:hypothetical protein